MSAGKSSAHLFRAPLRHFAGQHRCRDDADQAPEQNSHGRSRRESIDIGFTVRHYNHRIGHAKSYTQSEAQEALMQHRYQRYTR